MRQNIDTIGHGTTATGEVETTEVRIDNMLNAQNAEIPPSEEVTTSTAEANSAVIADLVERARVAAAGETTPEAEIDKLTEELDQIDSKLIEAVKRRTDISRQLADARGALGAPRRVIGEESSTITRFGELGELGGHIGLAIINMGLRQPSPNPEN